MKHRLRQSREHPGVRDDFELLRLLAEYVNLRPFELADLSGRVSKTENPLQHVHRRLRALRTLGYCDAVNPPDDRFGANIWFLTRKGIELALDEGWIPDRVDATDRKLNGDILHEIGITEFHIRLKNALQDGLLFWYQRKGHIFDRFEGGAVNPDAFFGIRLPDGSGRYVFLEWERSKPKWVDHQSSLITKHQNYRRYFSGHFQKTWNLPNAYVATVLPSAEKAANFVAKMKEEGLVDRKFLFTDRASLTDICGPIFASPADGAYSLVR